MHTIVLSQSSKFIGSIRERRGGAVWHVEAILYTRGDRLEIYPVNSVNYVA